MPPIIPDAPWWANALLMLAALAVVTGGTVWVAQIQTRKRLDEINNQVTNSHESNLRDDLDSQREAINRVGRQLTDLRETMRSFERSLDRRYKIHGEELRDAIEDRKRDIQGLREEVTLAIRDHASTCPARNPQPRKEGT